MAFEIETARIQDAEAIAAVHISSWRETYRGLLPNDLLENLQLDQRAELWRQIIASNQLSPSSAQYIARSKKQIVGFGSCGPGRSRTCVKEGYEGEISTLYVLNSHQHRGIGSALFHQMTVRLSSEGINSLSLWVLDTNLKARSFYERRGGVAFDKREDDHRGTLTTEIAYGWRNVEK